MQPANVRANILGPTRYDLWRKGKVKSLGEFVDAGYIIPLHKLQLKGIPGTAGIKPRGGGVPPIPTTTPRTGPPAPTAGAEPDAGYELMTKAETTAYIKEHAVGKDLETALTDVAASLGNKGRLPKALDHRLSGKIRKTRAKSYKGRYNVTHKKIKISTYNCRTAEDIASTLSHEVGHALEYPITAPRFVSARYGWATPQLTGASPIPAVRARLKPIMQARYERLRESLVAYVNKHPAESRKWAYTIERLGDLSRPKVEYSWVTGYDGLGINRYRILYDLPAEFRPDDFISPYSYADPHECVAEGFRAYFHDRKKAEVGEELGLFVEGLAKGQL